MSVNKWPPPPGVTNVIAKVEGSWIEMDLDRLYGWTPISLRSHGCGCCAVQDPEPTLWIAIPEGQGANQ